MTEERLKKDLIKACTNLKGECKDDQINLFSEVSNDKIRGNEQKLKHSKVYLNTKNPLFFPSRN